MKKIFGIVLFTLYILTANSQIIYLEIGKVITSFDYQNSAGYTLDNLSGPIQNNLGLGVRMPIYKTAWHISLEGTYNTYDIKGSDPTLGNYYEWNVEYIGADLGIDYESFKPDRVNHNVQDGFSFYIKGIIASDFLVNGVQILNNQVFELSDKEEFDKPIYFIKGSIGLNYYISPTYIVFLQYMYSKSFLIGNYNNKEQLRFINHTINIGFSVNLQDFR